MQELWSWTTETTPGKLRVPDNDWGMDRNENKIERKGLKYKKGTDKQEIMDNVNMCKNNRKLKQGLGV